MGRGAVVSWRKNKMEHFTAHAPSYEDPYVTSASPECGLFFESVLYMNSSSAKSLKTMAAVVVAEITAKRKEVGEKSHSEAGRMLPVSAERLLLRARHRSILGYVIKTRDRRKTVAPSNAQSRRYYDDEENEHPVEREVAYPA